MAKKTTTVQIQLPARQRAFVRRRIAEGGYETVNDYFSALIRRDQQAQQARSKGGKPRYQVDSEEDLADKIDEAIESGDYQEATPQWWAGIIAETGVQVRKSNGRRRRRRSPP